MHETKVFIGHSSFIMLGARHIMSSCDGKLPSTVSELLKIPGIGRYTAGAIASLAFGQVEPVVDGNVMRVLARVRRIRAGKSKMQLKLLYVMLCYVMLF